MNENLNLIEMLKNCPRGHVLYSTIHGEVKFSHIDKDDEYPIVLIHSDIDYEYVDSFGKHLSEHNGECTLFPSKDERDWSKFTVFKDVIVHSRNEFPSLVPNEAFSVDVITYDEEGMMNIGFYSYDLQKWSFHTDTLVDYSDMDFVWMYKPDFLKIN